MNRSFLSFDAGRRSRSPSPGSPTTRRLRAAEPDRAMFGAYPSRNQVSTATGLPAKWDIKTGQNVKWTAKSGSQSYAGPVVADGKVFIGTNNEAERDPQIKGDKGVVMAFDARTGEFLWQMVTDKLPSGRVNDWPQQGVCSTPFVEGKRLYYTSNQGRIVALDTEGLKDGNAGFQGEKYKGAKDGDVIWEYDMIAELDVFPHNLAASSPLVVGDLVFVTTANGVDEGHVNIPSPRAPSFIALDKNTGKLVWESSAPGEGIIHSNWSNATYGTFGGKDASIFPAGDGYVYGLDPTKGTLLWKFNGNPKDAVYVLGAQGTKNDFIASAVVHDSKIYVGMGQDPEHGEGVGNFWVFDPAGKTGDITDNRHEGLASRRQGVPPHDLHGRDPGRHRLRGRPLRLPVRARRQDRRSTSGPTTCWPRCGPRPSSRTARSTSATRTAT